MVRCKRSERGFNKRRKVLPGYPIETPFNNIDEVREYVSGDSITCLLCGKEYRRIGYHIETIHEMTMDEYREKYKIPWTYSLICKDSSSISAAVLKKRVEEGYIIPFKKGEELKELHKAKKRKCPFKKEVSIQNLKEYILPKKQK